METERVIAENIKKQIEEELKKKIETYGHNFWEELGIEEIE